MLVFCAREWPYVYAIMRGGKTVQDTVKIATHYFDPCRVWWDVGLAAVIGLAWPVFQAVTRVYNHVIEIEGANRIARQAASRLHPVSELREFPEYINAQKDAFALAGYVAALASRRFGDESAESRYFVGVTHDRTIPIPGFVQIEQPTLGLIRLNRLDIAKSRSTRANVAFTIERLPISLADGDLILCAHKEARVEVPTELGIGRAACASATGELIDSALVDGAGPYLGLSRADDGEFRVVIPQPVQVVPANSPAANKSRLALAQRAAERIRRTRTSEDDTGSGR